MCFCHFRIKHQQELVGKSTATHACILAPTHVTQYDFPVSCNNKKEIIILLYIQPITSAIRLSKGLLYINVHVIYHRSQATNHRSQITGQRLLVTGAFINGKRISRCFDVSGGFLTCQKVSRDVKELSRRAKRYRA